MPKKSKIAIVHDSLNVFGGAEKVISALLKIYPQATLYTLFYNDSTLKKINFNSRTNLVFSSILQHFPFLWTHTTFIQFISPLLWKKFDLSTYDFVIINSTHLMPNLIKTRNTNTLHYIHSLPKNIFGIEPYSRLQYLLPLTSFLKKLYLSKLSQKLVTSSKNTQQKIRNITNYNAGLVYPPIDNFPLAESIKKKFYISVGRIDKNKGLDLLIKTCTELVVPLVIVGEGNPAYTNELKKIAGKSIQFLGFLPTAKINKLYNHAKALIFASPDEDFGIAPIEALKRGVPVIAYKNGGPKEYIVHKVNGLFFNKYTRTSLASAIKQFENTAFNPKIVAESVEHFSHSSFRKKIRVYEKKA